MEKKIIAIMVTLVVVAALVVAFVMVAAGGVRRSGGFTTLFDKLDYKGNQTHGQELELPTSWHEGDDVSVSDMIVDMTYEVTHVSNVHVYTVDLWFVYTGDKWTDPTDQGSVFRVPVEGGGGWLHVNHGQFMITVSSATNLSAEYSPGDVMTLETKLVTNGNGDLAFGDWIVQGVG